MQAQGVIVGCDQNQEWLLSWWWDHYSKYNEYPVAFMDFGMSEQALSWCRERGVCLSLDELPFTLDVPSETQKKWESCLGKEFWLSREAWFKKPLACLQSPFSTSLWIDLDCQVNGRLEPLFNALFCGGEIALVPEPESYQIVEQKRSLLPNEICYNSGVMVFTKESSIIRLWVEIAARNNDLFITDQHALSRAIFLHQPSLVELPPIYNWVKLLGPNEDALIYHYTGGPGKAELLKNMSPEHLQSLERAIQQNAYLVGLLQG